ncbi:hypothetical protein Droror1_Dr00015995 [Drosera rotundifolia]
MRRITSLPPHFLSSSPQQRQQDLGRAAKATTVALGDAVKAEALAVGGAANLNEGVLDFKRRRPRRDRGDFHQIGVEDEMEDVCIDKEPFPSPPISYRRVPLTTISFREPSVPSPSLPAPPSASSPVPSSSPVSSSPAHSLYRSSSHSSARYEYDDRYDGGGCLGITLDPDGLCQRERAKPAARRVTKGDCSPSLLVFSVHNSGLDLR